MKKNEFLTRPRAENCKRPYGAFIMIMFFALFLNTQNMYSQNQTIITGTVANTAGDLLPSASVLVKGTSHGTQTDFDGNYTLSVSSDATTLVVSYLGYSTQEVAIAGQSSINIQLAVDESHLDEIVVIGYGTMKESDVTGSIVSVNPEPMEAIPNNSVIEALKGSVAGLTVSTPDRPGEEAAFAIRGRSSFSAGNRPLVVLDGIPFGGSINSIETSDIASVEVLKDASAAAVYGSRSSNGVIIITTKKGKKGKPLFSISSNYGVSNPVSLIPVLNPEQYVQKIRDFNNGELLWSNSLEEDNFNAGNPTIDWYDRLIQSANTIKVNASVSGSTEKTSYYISGSYLEQGGIIANDDYSRVTTRINLTNKITDWWKFTVNTSLSLSNFDGVAVPLLYGLSPYSNWYQDRDPSKGLELFPMGDPYFKHPELNLDIDDYSRRLELWGLASSVVDIPFVKGLTWTTNFSMSTRRNTNANFRNKILAPNLGGVAIKNNSNSYNYVFDNILNYNKTFNSVHNVSATFLVSREYNQSENTNARSENFWNEGLGYNDLGIGEIQMTDSGWSENSREALMGRINYNFDDRYAITGTIRRDGSSRFTQNNKLKFRR